MRLCSIPKWAMAGALPALLTFHAFLEASPTVGYSITPRCSRNKRSPIIGACDEQRKAMISSDDIEPKTNSRRGFLIKMTGVLVTAKLATDPSDVLAFENRLDDKYANAIPQIGTQPKDLGPSQRINYTGLKECGNSPNCWVSSGPKSNNPARWLPAWESNGGSIEDVKRVVETYEVGQHNIDGGGFKILEYNPSDKYLYVQFQSYKAGYIDDFECWYNPESEKFDVRSSSRIGYSDLGVNALRLEYIGNRLEKEYGWTLERRKNGKLV